jgi:putative phage-type endonuclease
MTAQLLGHFEVESDEWHAARAEGLGGSEIAAVLGLSKWESRYSLWHRKRGLVGDREQSNPMTVGRYVESATRQWFLDQHIDLTAEVGGTYQSSERPWQIGSPDGLLWDLSDGDRGPRAILELKFAIYDTEWGAEGTDEIPPYYLTQCRWYLDVFGLDTCYVAVLFGGSGRFAEYVVHQDEADAMLMRTEARAFLGSLANNERPDIDAHGATYEVLRETAPGIGSGDLEVSSEVALQYLAARADLASATERAQYATNRVMGLLNDTERKRATHDGRAIAFKTSRNGGAPYLQAAKGIKE